MNNDLERRVSELIRHPKNLGELPDADAVGTVGNSSCGEFMRMWIKFKQQNGRRVIERASFQSFGCETAIAVASLATELVRDKTVEEALALSGSDLAGELGPLPPVKLHCAELVEGALRSALAGTAPETHPPADGPVMKGLLERFSDPGNPAKRVILSAPATDR